MMAQILSFDGNYRFLSNFYPAVVVLDGLEYRSVEHAYQAAKTLDPDQRRAIRNASTPSIAKTLGKKVRLRADWDDTKLIIMHELLVQKFTDPSLSDRLLATGDDELIEGNWWNDTYWGVCKGKGENHLGKLLMNVRHLIRKEEER
jgi:ribA/ribD-fused uncharacterized protein